MQRVFAQLRTSSTARALAPQAVLLVASYLFRLPPLLDARSTNSDAAVVGLQAMHMLRGELSPFLWGSGYQTSADAAVCALFFVVLGKTPLALMLSALTLHVVATFLVFATVRRRFDAWTALLLVAPLVLAPSSVHTYALYPPRQLSLTLALAAFWAIDGARGSSEKEARWLALGGLLAGLAISADPYPLLLLPILALYTLFVGWPRVRKLVLAGAAALVGLLPFVLLHRLPRAQSGQMTLTLDGAGRHLELLWNECLPWALSYRVYFAHHVMDYLPWDAPPAFHALGVLGAILAFAIVGFALASVRRASLPWDVRGLGFAGALVWPVTLAAFVVSVMAMDHFSMRYLAVLTLSLPFAAMPAARALGTRRFAAVYAPHVAAAAIAGWVGYGPFVRGVVPVRETPELADDYAFFDAMRARGLGYAEADYWASYRLTLLAREEIVVVPKNAAEDRYPPYRRAFEAAHRFAYLFDPGRSRESLADAEATLRHENADVEPVRLGGLTVFFVTRR